MAVRAFITGLAGTTITPDERAFLREREPWGFIIFKRNIETPAQVRRLTASVRDAVGREAPVLVDQEGGRVQRLGPPHWPTYPPGAAYGRLYDRNAADRRRASRRRRLRHWRPGLWGKRGEGRFAGARGGRRPRGRRGSAGPQAYSRARPCHGGQPRRASHRRDRPRNPQDHRFCRIPAALRSTAWDDRPYRIHGYRSYCSGHDFGHSGPGCDSGLAGISRSADERRYLHGGLVRLD